LSSAPAAASKPAVPVKKSPLSFLGLDKHKDEEEKKQKKEKEEAERLEKEKLKKQKEEKERLEKERIKKEKEEKERLEKERIKKEKEEKERLEKEKKKSVAGSGEDLSKSAKSSNGDLSKSAHPEKPSKPTGLGSAASKPATSAASTAASSSTAAENGTAPHEARPRSASAGAAIKLPAAPTTTMTFGKSSGSVRGSVVVKVSFRKGFFFLNVRFSLLKVLHFFPLRTSHAKFATSPCIRCVHALLVCFCLKVVCIRLSSCNSF
jgi:hypothetical protein